MNTSPLNDTTARHKRTTLEAFPCDAQQAVAMFGPKKHPYKVWVAVLLAVLYPVTYLLVK